MITKGNPDKITSAEELKELLGTLNGNVVAAAIADINGEGSEDSVWGEIY